ncbi:O-antigen ligase family protein [Streptomyces sp. M600PL45_2]|uniref:O-antigen ligase family protein n=1 Tax=Streptomyces marispadix TaxID=2922868 RepID=A0ABS9SRZ5_9ACTN|nr:O-antigen ligase family protein [Streptomyces marispadix]
MCSLALGRVRRRPVFLAALTLAAGAVTGVAFAVAQGGLPHGATVALHKQLTGHRVELWRDALAITRDHPVLGTGPDSFGELSATARAAGARATVADEGTFAEETAAETAGQAATGSGPAAVDAASASDGKPHSAPLQVAAEQGLPGLALLASAFGWLLLALRASPRPTPVALTAAAALSALAALAAIGNALSFTQVTAGAGLLAGIACARRLS